MCNLYFAILLCFVLTIVSFVTLFIRKSDNVYIITLVSHLLWIGYAWFLILKV